MKSNFIILVILLTSFSSCKNEKVKEKEAEKEVNQDLPLNDKRVLILGNSITQHGHYVDFIEYYLRQQYPENQLDIISIGLSGETVSGTSEDGREFPRPNVLNRLQAALDEIKPDLVLACYGMNDGNFNPLDSLRFQAYKDGIKALKTRVEARNADLILITPTIFDPDPIENRVSKEGELHTYWHSYYKYNEVLGAYSNWLMSLESEELPVIDLYDHLEPILANMKRIKSDSTFVPDGVHPTKIGHFYMAQKILNDLYPNISIENPVSEIDRLQNDSLFVLVHKRRVLRSDGWRNYIGYTKGETVKSDDILTTKTEVKLTR